MKNKDSFAEKVAVNATAIVVSTVVLSFFGLGFLGPIVGPIIGSES